MKFETSRQMSFECPKSVKPRSEASGTEIRHENIESLADKSRRLWSTDLRLGGKEKENSPWRVLLA